MASSTSRNPFLSSSYGAPSQSPNGQSPNLHSAFDNLSLAGSNPPSPLPSRNPFVDPHTANRFPRSDIDARATPGLPTERKETGPQHPEVAVRRRGGEGLDSEEGLSESERREWEQHRESERLDGELEGGRRLSNGDYSNDDEALQAAIRASLASTGSSSHPSSTTSTSNPSFLITPKPPPLPNRPVASSSRSHLTSVPRALSPPQTQHVIPPKDVTSSDPPPAYSVEPTSSHSTTLDAGPARPAFAHAFSQPTQAQPLQSQPTGYSGGSITPQPNKVYAPPLSKPARTLHPLHGPPPPALSPRTSSFSTGPPRPPQPSQLPSDRPIVGRPLMNDGKVLVYPTGYYCVKCDNTGYKENDPSHPCRTSCWKRYGKPFSFVQLAWSGLDNRQRPLGVYRPPPLHPGLGGGYPGSGFGPASQPLGYTSGGGNGYGYGGMMAQGPPPGSVVYLPGDPRIGGLLCWRCGGSGTTLGFFLDSDTCSTCRGVGRVF